MFIDGRQTNKQTKSFENEMSENITNRRTQEALFQKYERALIWLLQTVNESNIFQNFVFKHARKQAQKQKFQFLE